MKAVRANKVYSITEREKDRYQKEGFDIIGDNGEVIAYGKGKTVPYGKYMEVVKELESMKKELAEVTEGKRTSKKATANEGNA